MKFGAGKPILLAQAHDVSRTFSHCRPTSHVLDPGGGPPPLNVELCRNKARNKFLDGIVLGNAFALNRIVIIGDGHVAWIADDIDDALVAWVERLVTLENAWAIESAQYPISKKIEFGD